MLVVAERPAAFLMLESPERSPILGGRTRPWMRRQKPTLTQISGSGRIYGRLRRRVQVCSARIADFRRLARVFQPNRPGRARPQVRESQQSAAVNYAPGTRRRARITIDMMNSAMYTTGPTDLIRSPLCDGPAGNITRRGARAGKSETSFRAIVSLSRANAGTSPIFARSEPILVDATSSDSPESAEASFHGSRPSLARQERTVTIDPLRSSPTKA